MTEPESTSQAMPPKTEPNSLHDSLQQQPLQAKTVQHEAAPQPIRVFLDSPTDWPTVIATLAVGLGSILTSLIVGYISRQNQRVQVQSSIATLRSAWIKELRQSSGEFIGLAALIGRSLQGSTSYLDTQEGRQQLSILFDAASRIELMLDPDKTETREIASKMSDIVESLQNRKFEKANEQLNELKSKMSKILEKGWDDVKEDLRNPGKSLESGR